MAWLAVAKCLAGYSSKICAPPERDVQAMFKEPADISLRWSEEVLLRFWVLETLGPYGTEMLQPRAGPPGQASLLPAFGNFVSAGAHFGAGVAAR